MKCQVCDKRIWWWQKAFIRGDANRGGSCYHIECFTAIQLRWVYLTLGKICINIEEISNENPK